MSNPVIDVRELLGLDNQETNAKIRERETKKNGGKVHVKTKEAEYLNRGSQRCIHQRRKSH